jgi:peptidoglycan/LPS O-acetylase OafA/YrhL
VIKIRWKYVASAVYVLIFVTSLTVAFFGQVDAIHDHDDVLWGVSTGLFITGACAAIYATIPESLPDHNEWAASSINVLCGVLIILMEAFDTDDVR